jgi:hypothetical protein
MLASGQHHRSALARQHLYTIAVIACCSLLELSIPGPAGLAPQAVCVCLSCFFIELQRLSGPAGNGFSTPFYLSVYALKFVALQGGLAKMLLSSLLLATRWVQQLLSLKASERQAFTEGRPCLDHGMNIMRLMRSAAASTKKCDVFWLQVGPHAFCCCMDDEKLIFAVQVLLIECKNLYAMLP